MILILVTRQGGGGGVLVEILAARAVFSHDQ